jgi:WD40 repeat protein
LKAIPNPTGPPLPDVEAMLKEDHSRSSDMKWALELDPDHDGFIRVRDLATGELSKEAFAREPHMRSFQFFPDNEHFATIGEPSQVKIWSIKTPLPASALK